MQRSEFDDIKDYEEFSRYYWYREELIGICNAHGLKSDGSKIELNQVIQAYFSGKMYFNEIRDSLSAEEQAELDLVAPSPAIAIDCGESEVYSVEDREAAIKETPATVEYE